MNRGTRSIACLITLLLAATAWGRSSFVSPTSLPASLSEAAAAGDTSDVSGQPQGIKQQLRSEFAQLIVDQIHSLFGELRIALGLPAEPTDPASDPLAILETAITDVVQAKLVE